MRYLFCRWHFLLMALGLIALVQSSAAQLPGESGRATIIKGDADTREYRYITLANQLPVLLVSDVKAEKSAAALNIQVGSQQNPESRPGLAQLLARTLIKGSEKYPEPGDYQRFIQQYGGEEHATTSAHSTQYSFSIDNTFFESALDRFASFFLSPLFAANVLEVERYALGNLYLASANEARLSPSLYQWDIYRSLFNPEHPAARFPDGGLEALADRENRSIRDDVLSFYRETYSANLMTLTLVGNLSLDNLQKMVEERFALIPNSNKTPPSSPQLLFNEGTLPVSLRIRSAEVSSPAEQRQLSLSFPVPSFAGSYQTKPWAYIAHLLRGEAAGSLLSLLKSLGWAEATSVSEFPLTSQDNFFQISLVLTPEGGKAKDQIVSAVFEYLKMIELNGINDWRFGELKKMAELEFRFQEQPPPLRTAVELAQAMHDYPTQDVLRGKYSYSVFDQVLLRRALAYLRKDNVIISWVAPEVKATTVSRHYQIPYGIEQGIAEVAQLKPLYRQKLFLPERNIFIPKNASVKVPSMRFAQGDDSAKNVPSLLFSNDQFNLWFLQDQYYRSPKAELNFRVILPVLNNSLENAARNQLFIALVMDKLNEYTYSANFAGLTFAATANARGFDLQVSGYTDRQSLLVNRIVDVMAQASFSPNRFEAVKAQLIREGLSPDNHSPSAILMKKIVRLQYQPQWDLNEYVAALQKTSFSSFKSFSGELLRDAKMDSLFYGNLYPQDAIKTAALVDHQLLKKRGNRVLQSAKGFRTYNRANKSWLYLYPVAGEERSLLLYIPALSPTIGAAAHSLLLNNMLQPAFADKLPGEDGGADLRSLPIKNLEASVFMLQSRTASGEQMAGLINGFFAEVPTIIAENFAAAKSSLLLQLRKAPASLPQQAEKFWQSILLGDITFSRQQELIAAVAAISVDSLQDYYNKTFLQKNRRLWLSSVELDAGKDFELIDNIGEYQQKQQAYLYP